MREHATTRGPHHAAIPMREVGPIKIIGEIEAEVTVPLATLESPLWPSVGRGAKVSRATAGIRVAVVKDFMTRSILLEAPNLTCAQMTTELLEERFSELAEVVAATSRFTTLDDYNWQLVGKLIFIRFNFKIGDAAGHNMSTKAADELAKWIITRVPQLSYVSVSANYCVDKKVSAVNGILGRGKYVVAEITIPRQLCLEILHTTPEQIVALNVKKNLLGSTLAGGVRTANAHFANMLLAFYLATGQDAANIVEGSQGMVYTEVQNDELYFSVTVPNIIVGAVGSGKKIPFVAENLQKMGCYDAEEGTKGRRLAAIAAATILCGELSLLAALTNQGELVRAHMKIERKREEQ